MTALFPLGVTAEMLVNGSWTDISSYVYQRDGVTITGGRASEGDVPQPAQATLTLKNGDGRFSPGFTGGAYYPYLKRNTQLRISVAATSSSGNFYSGYRFWGEVSKWPPMSDISGHDVYVKVTASGPLRRLRSGGGKGSALTRYYNSLTGAYAPVAYWPCEEDPDATIIGAGIDGGTSMAVTAGTPLWKAVSDFNGSAPVGMLNNSTWDGLTGSAVYSGDDIYATPGTYTWTAPVASATVRCWGPGNSGGAGGAGGGAGGGGGEFAAESAVALTAGNGYTFTVEAGGSGTAQVFAGDAVTVTAHAALGSSGGTGSTNTTHHDGGTGFAGTSTAGGGGGGSGGTAAAGNSATSVSGAAAVAGGGAGGNGGSLNATGSGGGVPGGGGGGGGASTRGGSLPGGSGGAGKVELIYTPPSGPPANVVRFILMVPSHGGSSGKVLLRAITGGTINHLEFLYQSGGKLQLRGYDNVGALKFDSGGVAFSADGQPLMVSGELTPSGADVAWKLTAVKPGAATVVATSSGTVTTASVGNVSEVITAPNADVTKTAIGHISVQYALIPLTKVSKALHGHHTEMGADRFARLCGEIALGADLRFAETADHWGFETGTQSWSGSNGAVTQSAVTAAGWPSEGSHSLLLTASGAGQWKALSPTGVSGQPVNPGDIVSAAVDIYAPAALSNVWAGFSWYTAAGALISTSATADTVFTAGQVQTLYPTFTAPATAAFFSVQFGNHASDAAGTLLYGDHVRVHPRMGPQTRKELHSFLREIEVLDQGILLEARHLWGLGYRTRISLINQSPAVTLDYATGNVSPPLEPVADDQKTKNDITVHRHKGSKVRVTQLSGAMSVLESSGVGRYRKPLKVAAELDQQLIALAEHLLALGTDASERYPTIAVNLARAGLAGNTLAPLMSAVAGIEIGDYVKVVNLPFWYPSTTAKQLVIGYTEIIGAYQWEITWNCASESPYEITATNLRRW